MAAASPVNEPPSLFTGTLIIDSVAGPATNQPTPINSAIAASFISINALWTLLPDRMPKQLIRVRMPRVTAATACSGMASPDSSRK